LAATSKVYAVPHFVSIEIGHTKLGSHYTVFRKIFSCRERESFKTAKTYDTKR